MCNLFVLLKQLSALWWLSLKTCMIYRNTHTHNLIQGQETPLLILSVPAKCYAGNMNENLNRIHVLIRQNTPNTNKNHSFQLTHLKNRARSLMVGSALKGHSGSNPAVGHCDLVLHCFSVSPYGWCGSQSNDLTASFSFPGPRRVYAEVFLCSDM